MVEESYDTPSAEELYQGNEEFAVQPIPAEIINVVRIDQMPRTFGMMDNFIIAADRDAFRVLGSDPRRAQVTMWCTGSDLVIATTQAAAEANQGAILSSGLAVPVHFMAHDEVWIKPDSSAVDDVVLSVVVEMWAR